MRCDEFELLLQQGTDDRRSEPSERALRQHAESCPACRDLEDGFRLVSQAFAASRLPEPSSDLTNRIVTAALRTAPVQPRWHRQVPWLAAAATLLVALGWWFVRGNSNDNDVHLADSARPTVATEPTASDAMLFPERAAAAGEQAGDGAVLAQAVEPFSEMFWAVGRSLASPVRPIASATSEALGSLLNDLPETDLSSMPGVREVMPAPMKKDMPEMRPSS